MSYHYEIEAAGQVIGIDALYLQTGIFLKNYLASGKNSGISVRMTEKDIRREWARMLENPRYDKDFVNRLPGYYFESFALNRKVSDALLPFGTITFHGSAVAVDGICFVFTADSGIGKSTYAKMWVRHFGSRAYILNDDKPFLHLEGKAVTVYGSPWDGKHHTGRNGSAPLSSICFLERAGKSSVHGVSSEEGLSRIRHQVFRPDDPADFELAEDLLKRISGSARFFQIGFTLDEKELDGVFEQLYGGTVL